MLKILTVAAVNTSKVSFGVSADESVRRALHGDGHMHWFDKSFSIVLHPNGRASGSFEHSWADAPVSSQVFEYAFYQELRSLGYTLGELFVSTLKHSGLI